MHHVVVRSPCRGCEGQTRKTFDFPHLHTLSWRSELLSLGSQRAHEGHEVNQTDNVSWVFKDGKKIS